LCWAGWCLSLESFIQIFGTVIFLIFLAIPKVIINLCLTNLCTRVVIQAHLLIYLYNILGFVHLWWYPIVLSICLVIHRHSSHHPSPYPSRWRPPVLAFPWRLTLSLHLRPLVLAFP
jgi:hypothetical protein